MIIPAGRYKLKIEKKIYKTGTNQKTGRDYDHWMSFTDGREFTTECSEDRLTAVNFDMDIEIDTENMTITLG